MRFATRLLLLFLVLGVVSPVEACPFCGQQAGNTLTGEIKQASMVLFGSLKNAQPGKKGDTFDGRTDLSIEVIIKDHADREKGDSIRLNRYLPLEKSYKYLVFCDIFQKKVDPYRGVAVKADSNMAAYLKGLQALQDEKPAKRLRFFFDYLDDPDVEISNDALKEFANADYKDYKDMARDLPASKIAGWLKDPKTPSFRYGLYASLLGHCGKPEHAAVLHDMLKDPEKRSASGVDGIMAAYTMLKPKEGWDFILETLKDPKKEFLARYAGLRAVRFFWDYRTDLISKERCAEAAAILLDQNDISDLALEDLRKWGRWELADKVVALTKTSAVEVPIVRRAILRYAIAASKASSAAAEYVSQQRVKDRQAVADAEELLKLEQAKPAATQQSKASGIGKE